MCMTDAPSTGSTGDSSKVTTLGSTPSRGTKQPNGCISMCCSEFCLDGDTIEAYREEALNGDIECATIVDMLIPLGYEDEDGPVYTCRHWDKPSGKCMIYERRPSMCSGFPYGEKCAWPGCEYEGG